MKSEESKARLGFLAGLIALACFHLGGCQTQRGMPLEKQMSVAENREEVHWAGLYKEGLKYEFYLKALRSLEAYVQAQLPEPSSYVPLEGVTVYTQDSLLLKILFSAKNKEGEQVKVEAFGTFYLDGTPRYLKLPEGNSVLNFSMNWLKED